jgi:hypothetical protein
VVCQLLLDKLLYDTDRAIDLMIVGADPDGAGEPEWRAAAYGWVIRHFLGIGIPPIQYHNTAASMPGTTVLAVADIASGGLAGPGHASSRVSADRVQPDARYAGG